MSSSPSSRLISSVSSFDYLTASTHSHEHSREGSGGESSDSSYISVSDEISSEDDEILLSFSEVSSPIRLSSPSPAISQRAQSPNTFSDDDYVVFGGVKTPEGHGRFESFAAGGSAVANVETLTQTLAQLNLREGRPRKARSKRFAPQHQQRADALDDVASVRLVSQAPSPHRHTRKPRRPAAAAHSSDSEGSSSDASNPVKSPSTPKSKKSKKKKAASPKSSPSKASVAPVLPKAKRSGLGERPIVDDVSEAGDHRPTTPGYEEAVQYVTS